MLPSLIHNAAEFLILRRTNPAIARRLPPELRPQTTEDAIEIQKTLIASMDDVVGGWKCTLPTSERINIGAIFAKTIFAKSPCPIKLDNGICRIEPEIAFRFKTDLPPRDIDYSDPEITAALDGALMALEFIQRRYSGTEEVSYLENLADCLFNQGVYLGPEIELGKAMASTDIDFVLTQEYRKTFTGKHPNNGPLLPVLWLVNFLGRQGIGIQAGQIVITGSFAGVHEVKPNMNFTLEYTGIGEISLMLQPWA